MPFLKTKQASSFLFFLCLALSSNSSFAFQRQVVVVKEVLTGDTVRLEGGKTLKYAGLQAPPMQSIIPLVREYGQKSKEFNESLVLGKKVSVEWGPRVRDEHNNLLGYVFLEDGSSVNKAILKAGHAKTQIVAPNLRYAAEFRGAELEARRKKLGQWKEEPENPFIKSAYIGEKNTKIYYFPTSPELERIPEANLIHFQSRVDAKAAGYRACSTCSEDQTQTF